MLNEKYLIKWGEELGWALVVGIVGYIATELAAQDLATLDVKAFAVALAAGAGRLAVAIVLNQVRKMFAGG
jgi:hypothetical protein